MQKTCAHCGVSFAITDDDRAFLQKLSPVIGGKTFELPEPTHCPECRQQRRLSFRNDWNYYHNTCALCRKLLISVYSPDKNIPVLCEPCFWSDQFDPVAYGREINWNKPFLEQFAEMKVTVPRLAIYHTQSENSDYTIHSSRNRNCYMASSLIDNEEVHFSDFTFESRDCMDHFSCGQMELCYECIDSLGCFNCDYCELCTNLSDSMLCFDCKGSQNLIGCVGIRNRAHYMLNQESSEEECRQAAARLKTDMSFREVFWKKFENLKLKTPVRDSWTIQSENCTGNFIRGSKNVSMGFNVRISEDVRYIYECHKNADCMDVARVGNSEMLYECKGIIDLRFGAFCNLTYQSDHCLYCDNSQQLRDSFGCMSMKKNQHCILNKKYSKEDYAELVQRIIEKITAEGSYGEFFPVTLSPFGYNETKAMEWYPMTEEQVHAKGWNWSHYELPMSEGLKTIPASSLPSSISDVPDDILDWAILCEVTGKPFRIIKQELEFYRKKGLPIPHRSPKQRHQDRSLHHKDRTLFDRTCAKCGKGIATTYAPQRPEIVYCEQCYLEVVY